MTLTRGAFTTDLSNKMLDHIFKDTAHTAPSELWLALGNAEAEDTGNFPELTAAGHPGYERQKITFGNQLYGSGNNLSVYSDGPIRFPMLGSSWTGIQSLAIFNAKTGGDYILYGNEDAIAAVDCEVNDHFEVADRGLYICLDGFDSYSDYLVDGIMRHVFFGQTLTRPSSFYMALATATITSGKTGTTITEPSGGGYARKSISGWDEPASAETANSSAITFDIATANWSTLKGFAVVDASSGGNMLIYGSLSDIDVVIDDEPQFALGDLTVKFDYLAPPP